MAIVASMPAELEVRVRKMITAAQVPISTYMVDLLKRELEEFERKPDLEQHAAEVGMQSAEDVQHYGGP